MCWNNQELFSEIFQELRTESYEVNVEDFYGGAGEIRI